MSFVNAIKNQVIVKNIELYVNSREYIDLRVMCDYNIVVNIVYV